MDLKSAFKDVAYTLVRALPQKSGAAILMYHSVDTNDRFFTVTPQDFERQMRWLHDKKFNVVSLDQLAEYRKSGHVPKKTVCITFDDGYLDNYTEAFPILKKFGFPATIFVTTGDLQGAAIESFPPLPKIDESQLRELEASKLVSIESHSVSHPKFTKISEEEAEREARDSKAYIEQLLGKKCVHFAYPKGRNDEKSRDALKRAGIVYAYTTLYGFATPQSNDLAIPRNGIDTTTTMTQFKGIVSRGRFASPFSAS